MQVIPINPIISIKEKFRSHKGGIGFAIEDFAIETFNLVNIEPYTGTWDAHCNNTSTIPLATGLNCSVKSRSHRQGTFGLGDVFRLMKINKPFILIAAVYKKISDQSIRLLDFEGIIIKTNIRDYLGDPQVILQFNYGLKYCFNGKGNKCWETFRKGMQDRYNASHPIIGLAPKRSNSGGHQKRLQASLNQRNYRRILSDTNNQSAFIFRHGKLMVLNA